MKPEASKTLKAGCRWLRFGDLRIRCWSSVTAADHSVACAGDKNNSLDNIPSAEDTQ